MSNKFKFKKYIADRKNLNLIANAYQMHRIHTDKYPTEATRLSVFLIRK